MEDASTSRCTRQLGTLKLSDTFLTGGGSSKAPDNLTTPMNDVALASKSSFFFSGVEERIQQSKSHWSTLSDQSGAEREKQVRPRRFWQKLIFWSSNKEDGAVAEVSNVEVFEDLQRHPKWGSFFEKQDRFAGFKVGEKFAEGGQAELHYVQVTGNNPRWNDLVRKRGTEFVLKIFKKGSFLQNLQFQVPHGYLDFRADFRRKWVPGMRVPRFESGVVRGVLLKDGRFAFLMEREQFDLRYVIERNMKSNCPNGRRGPFSKEEAELIMYQVALGVDWLHSHNIIHRDLKASNVLVKEYESGHPKLVCYVADFESSVGVIGTGFFRAPEILKACRDGKLWERSEVFSKKADIYSYGMVYYEVLTGKLPFEGHFPNDYDLVLNGQYLVMPDYIEDWTCELLKKCWQLHPTIRPRIGEIIDLFLVHSLEARKYERKLKNIWGQNYRDWSNIQISSS